jgi:hypothetical protein
MSSSARIMKSAELACCADFTNATPHLDRKSCASLLTCVEDRASHSPPDRKLAEGHSSPDSAKKVKLVDEDIWDPCLGRQTSVSNVRRLGHMSQMSLPLSVVMLMDGTPGDRGMLGRTKRAWTFVFGFFLCLGIRPRALGPGSEDPEVLLRVIHFIDGLEAT